MLVKHLQALWSHKWMPSIWIPEEPTMMSMVGVVQRMLGTTMSKEIRCYWMATFQNLSCLFQSLLPLACCSLWHDINANPHSLTQLPLQGTWLDHLHWSWIKLLLVCSQLTRMNSLLKYHLWCSLVAWAALHNRFAVLGNTMGETTPLCMLFGDTPQIVHWSTFALKWYPVYGDEGRLTPLCQI